MKRTILICSLILTVLTGCASTKPKVWIDKDVVLKEYTSFEILPATNDTGKTFDFDIADKVTKRINERISAKGFLLAQPGAEGKVMVIKTSITSYEPGSVIGRWLAPGAGKTQCVIKSTLTSKETGKILAEMVASEAIAGGGFYTIGADKYIINMAVDGIVDELEKQIKEQDKSK